ncbi:BTAD domain-containing putative transcriptional regulator [Pelagibius sp. Alg239-R121]|uniref:AfsR/SARP family transcriptional regulator n=1 Tax=Pelagibius sp. Alg239-R121 TaxID=2993448 RepID=UPI0024A695F3|nr:BTAD domain-containing putative transcriptional regulator [Pelagibius sp. Alg239-R121]
MADLKLLILGPVRLETADGKGVGRLGVKAKALLAYLAMQPHGNADRDLLANLLWDSRPQAEARHALRQALLTLRTQLGNHADSLLKSDRTSLQLRLDVVDVDLLQFKDAFRSGDDGGLVGACGLWRGSFCDGLDVGAEPFECWLLSERARLDELAAIGFRRIANLEASVGRFEAAVEAAQRCVALNPFDDSVHADLIDLYGQRGWPGPARKAYRRCIDLFQRELGEVPDESVHAAMARALDRRGCQSDPHQFRPTPGRRLPPVAVPGKPAANLHISAVALSVVAVFSASIFAGAFLRDESKVTVSRQEPAPLAWVGTGAAEAYPQTRSAVFSNRSAEISRIGSAQRITAGEAISRALQLDPDYAYLYPAGC